MFSGSVYPGSIVAGRYRIEAELGHGGMGAVYRAVHVELGRQVALKMVLPEVLALDEGLARFRREAELAQKLEHPNTVRLYDYGQTETGLPFIAFELLRGTPLDKALRSGGMAPARVARIVSQVLKSLMEAHAQGIIHRDIKPPNVFLCEFSGEQDFVKVLDFGIAKSTNARTLLTQTGLSPGTPNYMAPELLRGEALTPAADVYAVGLMMVEMLTGRLVFSGPPTDVVTEQISPRPVPLPPELATSPLWPIIVRAAEKDVTRRYRSAGEMLGELDTLMRSGVLEGPRPVTIRPPQGSAEALTVIAPRPLPKKSSPLPFIIGGVVALMLASIAIFAFGLDRHEGPSSGESGDPVVKKKKKKHTNKLNDDEDEKVADTSSIKGRLEKLGYKIISESNSKQPNMKVSTWVGSNKASQTVSVYLYEPDDETVTKSLETSLVAKGSKTKRVGKQLYWVLTSPADESLADDVIDELLR
jgi:serine/threonine protein kinase